MSKHLASLALLSADTDEHENGKIWSATLWDIWTAVGRSVADRIIIDSQFQLE